MKTEPDWEKLEALILPGEGFRPFPYDDAKPEAGRWRPGQPLLGTLTIGFGETRKDIVQRFVASGAEMTRDEALALYRERIKRDYWVPGSRHITTELNPHQAAALASLFYNSGPDGPKRFAPELLAAINQRRFGDVARPNPKPPPAWIGLWAEAIINRGTKFEQGLRNRRQAEMALFAEPWIPKRKERQMFFFWHENLVFLAAPPWRSPHALPPEAIDPLMAQGVPRIGDDARANRSVYFDILSPDRPQ